jgi:molecular chaperone GrpE
MENESRLTDPEPGPPEPAPEPAASSGFKVSDRRFWNLAPEELEAEEERPKLPSYVEQLRHDLEEKDRQLREYIAAYKREVGEGLEKTKQRLERDAAQRVELMRGRLAGPMLEVLDALERSLAVPPTADAATILRGIQMVHLLMVQKLGELGLQRIASVGELFDPARHEAAGVQAVSDPAQDGRVVLELKPGFSLGERVVRPALVQVGKRA